MHKRFAFAFVFAAACGSPDKPPSNVVEVPTQPPPAETAPAAPTAAPPPREEPKPDPTPVAAPDDPNAPYGLDVATAGLEGSGPLVATMKTSKGTMECRLFDDKAPMTVANFVGLARGVRAWKAQDGTWVKRPAYDGSTFHRVIKGFMIQGGDPTGTGKGEPGYTIKDELWAGAKHDRPGLLCMANRGHDTNGMQFFITDKGAAHLDGNYTIFGECSPVA
ncbi:MAG TPA: peptidylprolyl isomerase, partial [Labilithrix sp.]